MRIELNAHPYHSGSELYQVSFVLKDHDDLYDTETQSKVYVFHPMVVLLVWERSRDRNGYRQWRRLGWSRHTPYASITGPRVLKDGTLSDKVSGYREVFTESGLGSPLTEYAASLPGLVELVERAEKRLPE